MVPVSDIGHSEGDKLHRDPGEGETCPQHHHRHLPGAERHHLLGMIDFLHGISTEQQSHSYPPSFFSIFKRSLKSANVFLVILFNSCHNQIK